MKIPLQRIVYPTLIVIGLGALVVIYFQTKTACINPEKICISYKSGWKQVSVATPDTVRLTKSKPGAVFQLSVSKTKIAGTVQNVASALDTQLKKSVSSYKLIKAEQIMIDNVRSVAMTYELAPSDGGRVMEQELVVVPLGDKTYLMTAEAAPSDLDQLKPEIDYILSHTEIKR